LGLSHLQHLGCVLRASRVAVGFLSLPPGLTDQVRVFLCPAFKAPQVSVAVLCSMALLVHLHTVRVRGMPCCRTVCLALQVVFSVAPLSVPYLLGVLLPVLPRLVRVVGFLGLFASAGLAPLLQAVLGLRMRMEFGQRLACMALGARLHR
jgi:hypothetical protein